MKTRYWILIFAIIAALSVIGIFAVRKMSSGHIANIYQNGVCIRSIDLFKVREAYTFTVTDENGHVNTVEVQPGRIRVVSANCPDQICVNTGWIPKGAEPIVCMPARLSIRLEEKNSGEDGGVDAIAS